MKRFVYIYMFVACFLGACTDHDNEMPLSDVAANEIKFANSIEQHYTSRVNDGGFTDQDHVGIFVVDYKSNKPAKLCLSGNNADNVRFTFNEGNHEWKGERLIYWKNKSTAIDAYSYSPYNSNLISVDAQPFEVYANQQEKVDGKEISGYEASDFLWAKADSAVFESSIVQLKHRHLMAKVHVTLVRGESFTSDEWNQLSKSVKLINVGRKSAINLATGKLTVDETTLSSIIPYFYKDTYYAIIPPQEIAAGVPLMSVTIGDVVYPYERFTDMAFLAGKSHKFTMVVDKAMKEGDYTFKLLTESVSPWESESFTHNGTAREYVTLNIPEVGTFKECAAATFKDFSSVKNLKLVGEMNEWDFDDLRALFPQLEAVNMIDLVLKQGRYDFASGLENDVIPTQAFTRLIYLRYVAFPPNIKKIGAEAFASTQLTGDLRIPEGVEYIGSSAFGYSSFFSGNNHSNLYGQLELPASLRYIGEKAFEDCDFSGELKLPHNLTYIGDKAFKGCKFLTGELRLPLHLKTLGASAFEGDEGLTGQLVIPNSLTRLENNTFALTQFSSVKLSDNMTYIGTRCMSSSITGDLVLPSSLKVIDDYAFNYSHLSHIKFPDGLEKIGNHAFYNTELCDTLFLPSKIKDISTECFTGNENLTAIIIPASVETIREEAFSFCYNLTFVECKGGNPPTLVGEFAFREVKLQEVELKVPRESVEAYRNAPGWNKFKRITSSSQISCRPSVITLLNAGGGRKMTVQAPTSWKLVSCPSWCHVSAQEGEYKTQLDITVDEMPQGNGNRLDSIVFKVAGAEEETAYVKIEQYDSPTKEDEVVVLQKHTKGRGIPICIVGDGYDALDILHGIYEKKIREGMENFFAVEPYTTYRDYFDVYMPVALSNESMIGGLVVNRDAKFKTRLGDYSPDGRIGTNVEAVESYIQKVMVGKYIPSLENLLTILIANTPQYDGITYMGSHSIAVCPTSQNSFPYDARGIVQHEAGGHGFGKLGDEYIYHYEYIQNCKCTCCQHVAELQAAKSIGLFPNLSLDGSYKTNEWKQLFTDSRYMKEVDIFEGGFFHAKGVYRPEINSCMNNNISYFNAPSRMAIVKRIKELAGETFSFEEFVKNDRKNIEDKSHSLSRVGGMNLQNDRPLAHPILRDDYKNKIEGL